jgi:hypothetical protein
MRNERWYKKAGLKPITGFVSPSDKNKLKQLAKEADKSLTRYVSRLLEKHLQESIPQTPKT